MQLPCLCAHGWNLPAVGLTCNPWKQKHQNEIVETKIESEYGYPIKEVFDRSGISIIFDEQDGPKRPIKNMQNESCGCVHSNIMVFPETILIATVKNNFLGCMFGGEETKLQFVGI